MSTKTKKQQSDEKEYSLTKDEQQTLNDQNDLRIQYEYLASLVQRDMYIFLHGNVKKRLGLAEDVALTYDPQTQKVTTRPKPKADKA